MRVLIIDDDASCVNSLKVMLKSEGCLCESYPSDNIGTIDTLGSERGNVNSIELSYCSIIPKDCKYYDIVLLDIHFPGKTDGFDILVALREAGIKVPVLILSCLSSVTQKLKGFHYGADDYMTKPFNKSELMARIKAIVRRTKGHPESVMRIGDIVINLDSKRVQCGGEEVCVTNKEFIILKVLGEHCDKVVSKEQLVTNTYSYGDEPADDKIIDVFICKLRKKLKEALDKSRKRMKESGQDVGSCSVDACDFIETVWGRGYILKSPSSGKSDRGYNTGGMSIYGSSNDFGKKHVEEA